MSKNKRNKSGLNGKLDYDKYKTPQYLAEECASVLRSYLSDTSGVTFLDPCAGGGEFSNLFPNCLAYDIKPETQEILQADFLLADIPYQTGRVVVGNPPYGSRLNTAVLFYKKAVSVGDYVAFLLPASQLNNNKMFYEFDLVVTKPLGRHSFSGTTIDCVFNIYKRPESGVCNARPASREKRKLKDVTISEVRLKNKIVQDYDIRICAWGSVGKPILDGEHYAKELYLKVNREDIKSQVKEVIRDADWVTTYNMTGVYNLAQWHVIDYLKRNIPDLE